MLQNHVNFDFNPRIFFMDPPILVDLLSIIQSTAEGITISVMPIDLGA